MLWPQQMFVRLEDLFVSLLEPPFGLAKNSPFRMSQSWTQEMQKCIASFETLAQIAILYIFSRSSPGFRFPLRIPSLTDNSGTEAGGNKLFSTTSPLNHFLERLALLCAISGMELDLSHVSGDRNEETDALSRWDFTSDPPFCHCTTVLHFR